jgi:O-antigen ligase
LRVRRESPPLAATVLAMALLAGIVVDWSPRYWPLSAGILSLALAALCWAILPSRIQLPLPAIPVALVGVWGFLQIVFHRTVIPSFTLRASVTWLMCAVAFFLGSQILRSGRNRELFLKVMLWSLTALAVEALLQLYSLPVRVFGIFPAEESVIGTMIYTNQFAALMELGGPMALWQIKRGRVLAGGLAFAAMFAATVGGASRAGFALMLGELVVFVMLMIFSRQWRMRAGAAAILTVVLLVAWASAVAGTGKLWDKLREKNPYEFRHELLDSTIAMVRHSPWTGSGLGTWRAAYQQYATLDMAVIANEAHNDWAQWAADGGLPFMLLIVILAASITRQSLTSIWGIGILGVLVHCCVDYPMRAQPIAFLWFSLAGALAAQRNSPEIRSHSKNSI